MVFFFNDTASTDTYTYLQTLSLLDALPISHGIGAFRRIAARDHVFFGAAEGDENDAVGREADAGPGGMRGAAHAGAGAPERHPVDVFPADPPPLGLLLQARSRDGYLEQPEAPILGDDTHGRERLTAISRVDVKVRDRNVLRSEEHTSELQSLMRISYAVFCL